MTDYDEYVKKASKALRDHGAPTEAFPDDEFECCARVALEAVGFEDALMDAQLNTEGHERELADLRGRIEAQVVAWEREDPEAWGVVHPTGAGAAEAARFTIVSDLRALLAGSGEQPGEHEHGDWDQGGYCNRLVLDDDGNGNGTGTVCGYRPAPVVPDSAGLRGAVERIAAWLDDDEAFRIPDTDQGRTLYDDLRAVLAVVGECDHARAARLIARTSVLTGADALGLLDGISSLGQAVSAERAWREGFDTGVSHGIAYQSGNDEAWKSPVNPYRAAARSDEKEG